MAPMKEATTSYKRVLEQSKVGPAMPPDITHLPLTFLDISLAGPVYVRRQFFYDFPHSTHHFLHTTLPTLKNSLSIALQRFFPLAGNLLCPPPPEKPYIHCTGGDSVALTVAESASGNFNIYSSNRPKSLQDLEEVSVPELPWRTTTEEDGNDDDVTLVFPTVALKVTVFPNAGLCIAITYCHIMDGSCCSHFMKTWASFCRRQLSTEDMTTFEDNYMPLPSYDRGLIRDPRGLEAIFLGDYFTDRSSWKQSLVGKTSKRLRREDDECRYKATVVLRREDIEVLQKSAMKQWRKDDEEESTCPMYLSKFVAACGFVWASYVEATRHIDDDGEEEEECFLFAADCRKRMEYPVPENYFGNCINRCFVWLKRKEVKGDEGFVKGVKGIWKEVEDMKREPLRDAEKWNERAQKAFVLGSAVLLVTGSPKFGVYETDFGFGRPKKVEMVHSPKCVSLAEEGRRDGEGGLEFGLVFRRNEYEDFMSIVEKRLRTLQELYGPL
ncbi:unnamed protein product [Cuscuta campestris]|uniref:Uncharacterized protein n=1 Tax=Cuscuta campestris TaxID=132261 RepID=A0A484LB09_9ASTE|nr:unnamed protein product [Cuscuta campestris]